MEEQTVSKKHKDSRGDTKKLPEKRGCAPPPEIRPRSPPSRRCKPSSLQRQHQTRRGSRSTAHAIDDPDRTKAEIQHTPIRHCDQEHDCSHLQRKHFVRIAQSILKVPSKQEGVCSFGENIKPRKMHGVAQLRHGQCFIVCCARDGQRVSPNHTGSPRFAQTSRQAARKSRGRSRIHQSFPDSLVFVLVGIEHHNRRMRVGPIFRNQLQRI